MYFLHEHPYSASSWKEEYVQEIMNQPGVKVVRGDMCAFGMWQDTSEGRRLVMKPTGFMTNAQGIADRVGEVCSGEHSHVKLLNGRAHRAEVYPDELCYRIIQGLMDTMKMDGRIHADGVGAVMAEEEARAFDDVTGEELDSREVRKARDMEVGEIRKHKVYIKTPIKTCWDKTGKAPIKTRWIDINKGDKVHPDYRSRFVAKDFKDSKRFDLFAATPPLEALKLLLSAWMTKGIGWNDNREDHVMDVIDIRRAYFHAMARRDVFVELPEEDAEEGMCGWLVKSLYGTRDAAQNWEAEYTEFMMDLGFTSGVATPCVFFHKERDIRAVVHGDDFTLVGPRHSLDWFKGRIEGKFEIKYKGRMGPREEDIKSVRILNRVITWNKHGIEYESDQRHAEIIAKQMGLIRGTKGAPTPGIRRKAEEVDETELEAGESTIFRGIVARANYLGQDRSDIKFAVKELSRRMAKPRKGDVEAAKRLARYLVGRPRVVCWFKRQERPGQTEGWSDSDWAGCLETRKSTSGGLIKWGTHVLKTWSVTQNVIALSSGEAEFYAMVKTASQTLGMQVMMEDMGIKTQVKIITDATAARGIAQRKGLGTVRHLEVGQLWIQDKIARGEITVEKVGGKINIADALTKFVDAKALAVHNEGIKLEFREGRHEEAPEVAEEVVHSVEWNTGTEDNGEYE